MNIQKISSPQIAKKQKIKKTMTNKCIRDVLKFLIDLDNSKHFIQSQINKLNFKYQPILLVFFLFVNEKSTKQPNISIKKFLNYCQ